MAENIEVEFLIQHIGEEQARELVLISRLKSWTGVSQQAFDLLAQLRTGLGTVYGARSEARRAIEALQRKYPAAT